MQSVNSQLREDCKNYVGIIKEFYHFNKYYFNESLKDALINAIDCMELLANGREKLQHNYDGCKSHILVLGKLIHNADYTEQIINAFQVAYEAIVEVYMHNKKGKR